jgi:hypothetical protein
MMSDCVSAFSVKTSAPIDCATGVREHHLCGENPLVDRRNRKRIQHNTDQDNEKRRIGHIKVGPEEYTGVCLMTAAMFTSLRRDAPAHYALESKWNVPGPRSPSLGPCTTVKRSCGFSCHTPNLVPLSTAIGVAYPLDKQGKMGVCRQLGRLHTPPPGSLKRCCLTL